MPITRRHWTKPLAHHQLVFRICYVRSGAAYFTTGQLTGRHRQDGLGWDKSPYDMGAKDGPDHWCEHEERLGVPRYDIFAMTYRGDFFVPSEGRGRMLSVHEINEGRAPWLTYRGVGDGNPARELKVHATVGEFVDFVVGWGGEVGSDIPIPMTNKHGRPSPVYGGNQR